MIELSEESLRLSPWQQKPAKQLSQKLQGFLKLRGIDVDQACEELGLGKEIMVPLLQGRWLPDYKVALRLCAWMFGKKYFRKWKLKSEYRRPGQGPDWTKRTVTLTNGMWRTIDKLRKMNHLGTSEFIDLCVTTVVRDNVVVENLQKAADMLEEARVKTLLREEPELFKLLSGSLKLAVETWKDDKIKAEDYSDPFPLRTIVTSELDEWSEL